MAELVIKLVNGELAGKTFQGITKEVNAASLALKKAEVGTREWVDATMKLEKAKQLQADYKTQVDATAKASDSLKQSFGGILNQIPGFSQISGAMSSAKSGVGGLTSGFGTLKGAIAATGIGLLVIAVSTLVMWFSKTEAGANTLGGIFKGIGNVVDFLFGKLMSLAKTIGQVFVSTFNAIKGPVTSVIEFIKGIIAEMIRPFTALFDFITTKFPAVGKFFDAVKTSIKGFATELVNAVKEGYEFVQLMDDIEDRQAAMEITAKRAEIAENQLMLQARNTGRTYEERLALLDKADAITRKTYASQLALADEYRKAVNAEIDAEKKRQGALDDTDEQRDKRKDAELAYLNLKGQEIEIEEKIANRREQILGKKEKADEKAAADLKKRLEEEEKARQDEQKVWEKIEDDKIAAMDDSREKDLAHLKLNLEQQIAALDSNAPTYAAALAAAQELARKQKADINAKWDKTDADKLKKQMDLDNEIQLTSEIAGLNERFMTGEIGRQQYITLSEQAVRESEQRKLAIIKATSGVESKEYQDQLKKILDQDAKFAEEHTKQITQATIGTVNTLGNIFGELASMQDEGSEAAKDLMVAQAIMSTIAGSINAYTSTAQIPLIGPALAPIAAAVAFAAGISNVNKIKSTKLPKQKAEYGMVLTGPSHANGGIPIEAEGDEIILTKGVYRNPELRNMASALNVMGGGISFSTGGPVNPYLDASRAPLPSSTGGNLEKAILTHMETTMKYIEATNKRIDRLQVHNNVQETQKQMDRIKQIQNDANGI